MLSFSIWLPLHHPTQPQLPAVRDCRGNEHTFLQMKANTSSGSFPGEELRSHQFCKRRWDWPRRGQRSLWEGYGRGLQEGAEGRGIDGVARMGVERLYERKLRDLFLWCPYILYLTGQAFFMLIKVLVVLSILYDMILGIRVKK